VKKGDGRGEEKACREERKERWIMEKGAGRGREGKKE
jgi:hypothetical protein